MTDRPDDRTLRRLQLDVRRRLQGTAHGDHEGSMLGLGSEREELVQYGPGHDVRRIDWNASARTGSLRVWRTRAEHSVETWILLDRSPSMAFGTVDAEKNDVAQETSAAFALLGRGADRVGFGVLDATGLQWSPPGHGRFSAGRLLNLPAAPRDGSASPSLGNAIARLSARAPRRGIRIVVSDLLDPSGAIDGPFEWQAALRRLAARHDVIVVEVLDPRELQLPDVGDLVLTDPESGVQRQIQTSDRRFRNAYASAASRHRAATAAAVRTAGAAHLTLRTDDDVIRRFARFLARRRREPSRSIRRRTR